MIYNKFYYRNTIKDKPIKTLQTPSFKLNYFDNMSCRVVWNLFYCSPYYSLVGGGDTPQYFKQKYPNQALQDNSDQVRTTSHKSFWNFRTSFSVICMCCTYEPSSWITLSIIEYCIQISSAVSFALNIIKFARLTHPN